jgi:hypothetical protein
VSSPRRIDDVSSVSDLDVALQRRLGKRVEQPARVGVGGKAVPVATDEGYRRATKGWIVNEAAAQADMISARGPFGVATLAGVRLPLVRSLAR